MQTLKQVIAEAPTAAEAIEATKRYREYEREAKSIYIPLWDYWADALSPGDKRCDAFRKAFCEYSGAKYGDHAYVYRILRRGWNRGGIGKRTITAATQRQNSAELRHSETRGGHRNSDTQKFGLRASLEMTP